MNVGCSYKWNQRDHLEVYIKLHTHVIVIINSEVVLVITITTKKIQWLILKSSKIICNIEANSRTNI